MVSSAAGDRGFFGCDFAACVGVGGPDRGEFVGSGGARSGAFVRPPGLAIPDCGAAELLRHAERFHGQGERSEAALDSTALVRGGYGGD